MSEPQVIVALDFPDEAAALSLADRLDPGQCQVKVGSELFLAAGPGVVERLVSRGYQVFLDLKFHDIPNTVAAACRTAGNLGVWMMTVHAGGGRRMIQAAAEALAGCRDRPVLAAVTVLTSLGVDELDEIHAGERIDDWASHLAALAVDTGADALVCSALEVGRLRGDLGPGPILVTPGIRPSGASAGDQRRVVTPAEAVRAGADVLVIGRPITRSDDPLRTLLAIRAEISDASG